MELSFLSILVQKRLRVGKSANYKLRKNNNIPATVYGKNSADSIYISSKSAYLVLKEFYSGFGIIECVLNNDKFFVITKDIHKHFFKSDILHLDFQRVSLNDKISTKLFFKFIGESTSIGIKQGGFLIKHMSSVIVKSIVSKIPKNIVVDISNLKINESIFLTDISFPKEMSVPILSRKSETKFLVVSVFSSKPSEIKKVEK